MARRTIVELTDDLDGSTAEESVDFALDGKTYTIDLSEPNASKLRETLAPYVSAARRSGNGAQSNGSHRSNGSTRPDPAAVRAWASSNGYQVNARGRVSGQIVEAFTAAGN